jgi:hypothetical protein
LTLRIVAMRAGGLIWLEGSGHTAGVIQKAVLVLGVGALVVAAMGPRRAGSKGGAAASFVLPALGGAIVSLAWLSASPLRGLSASPLVELLLAVGPLAVLAAGAGRDAPAASAGEASEVSPSSRTGHIAAPSPRLFAGRAATAIAAILAVLSLAAFAKRHAPPSDVLPVGEALARIHAAFPDLREVLAGPGLTRGVVAHTAGAAGFTVVESARAGRAAVLAIASRPPAIAERDALVPRLGERVLDRYGLAGTRTLLRWTIYRPLSLRIDPAGDRPNIAIVSVDTLRADHLGSMDIHARPPRGWIAGRPGRSSTSARCRRRPRPAPSFSSLMTGRLPIAHGVRKNYEFLDPGTGPCADPGAGRLRTPRASCRASS